MFNKYNLNMILIKDNKLYKERYKIVLKLFASALICCFTSSFAVAQDCIMAQAESAAKISGSLTAASKICGLATPVEIATSKKEVKLNFIKNYPCAKDFFDAWYNQSFDEVTDSLNSAPKAEKENSCAMLKSIK
jgi:hypothetical protein